MVGLAAVLVGAAAAAAPAEGLEQTIETSILRAREAISRGRDLAGARTVGEQALAALAALRAGAQLDVPALDAALRRTFSLAESAIAEDYGGTYHAGLLLMLLEELGRRARLYAPSDLAGRLCTRLVELQDSGGGWGDMSRTEFAALGLDAAARLGCRVSNESWRRMVRFVRARQDKAGGWGYRAGDTVTGSMTAAGLAALYCAGVDERDGAVVGGLRWLRSQFRADANPGETAGSTSDEGSSHRFYFLAGLSSLARARGGWPERAWAQRVADVLVKTQAADGTWVGDARDCPTMFSVLFLVEARGAIAELPERAPVEIGVVVGDDREYTDEALQTLWRALVRWTSQRARVKGKRCDAAQETLRGLPLVLVLPGASGSLGRAAESALAIHAARGAWIVVEGQPGLPAGEVMRLGVRLASEAAAEAGSPAPAEPVAAPVNAGSGLLGHLASAAGAAPPRLQGFVALGARQIIVAPEGLFTLLGPEDLGVRSAAARTAVRAITWATSR